MVSAFSFIALSVLSPPSSGAPLDCSVLDREPAPFSTWLTYENTGELTRSQPVIVGFFQAIQYSEAIGCHEYNNTIFGRSATPVGLTSIGQEVRIPLDTSNLNDRRRTLLNLMYGKMRPKIRSGGVDPSEPRNCTTGYFCVRTRSGGGGVRGEIELPIPGVELIEASPDFEIGNLLIPEGLSSLSFIFGFENVGDGDWLAVYLSGERVWSMPGSAFEEGLFVADFDVSAYGGLTASLAFVLHSQGGSQARYFVGDTLYGFSPAEVQAAYRAADQAGVVGEPSSLVLVAGGLIVAGVARRNRARS